MFEFDPQDAFRFAQEQGIQARQRGDELIFKMCPYCRRTENSNQKKFSINLKDGRFNCFRSSCGAKGNMITLAREFDFELSNSATNEYYGLKNHRRFRRLVNRHPETKEFAIEYMRGRGISEEVTRKYNLSERKDRAGVLVFPFFDENNTLQFVKYRNTDPEKIEKFGKEYTEKDCKPILFGMNHCDSEANDTLVLTEGQIDSLSLAECGIQNAVSVPLGVNAFTWVPYCWDFLKKFKTLIVFGDREKGKITLLDDMTKRFMGAVKHVREEDYLECKDANELLQKHGKQAIINAVNNAVFVPVTDIVDLSEVEIVQPELREQIPTGYNHLNRTIGGFFAGQLGILTGKCGLGKSTLASMFVINSVLSGWNTFYYSGELANSDIREWLELQIVGGGRTLAYNINGKQFHRIKPEFSKAAAEWYHGRIYTKAELKFSDIEDGNQERRLPEIIIDAIVKYNCRFIVIDNLMTALSDNLAADKYREQSVFIKELTLLAQKYKVFILLVAHPRKGSGAMASNDDIAGSGDIGNLASLVMEYTRPPKDDDESEFDHEKRRVLRITKNRLTGDLDNKGFELYYDTNSKRISEFPDGTPDQFYLPVNLKMPNDGFESMDDTVEIPF